MKIATYAHLGQAGQLKIHFFNDRLMEVRFFPKDPDRYLQLLRDSQGIDLITKREVPLPPHAHVWADSEYDGQRYVGWADVRLEREFNDWIRRYT